MLDVVMRGLSTGKKPEEGVFQTAFLRPAVSRCRHRVRLDSPMRRGETADVEVILGPRQCSD